MKKIPLLAAAVLVVAVQADTIDFSSYTIVISRLETGPVEPSAPTGMNASIIQALSAASYDRDWSVAEWLAAHAQTRRKLERLSLQSRRTDSRFLSDGTMTVEREYELLGPALRLLLPAAGEGELLGRKACPCCGQPWPENHEPAPGVRPVPYDDGSDDIYTGILIDGRGLGFRPAIFPRVVTPDDREVIGPSFHDPGQLAEQGAVAYFKDRSSAFLSERIGTNPLIIRAQGITGRNSCDLIISAHDASRIHSSRHLLKLIADCRVGFIVE